MSGYGGGGYGVGPYGGSYSGAVLTDAPAGYWRLGETSGTAIGDSSGFGRAGTWSAAPTRSAGLLTSDTDGAVTLAGVITGQVLYDSGMDAPSALTVEAWIKSTASGSTFNYAILDRDVLSNRVWQFRMSSAGKLQFVTIGGSMGVVTATSTRSINDGSAHHVAATFDGSNLRLYIDGTLETTVAAVGAFTTNTTRLGIGVNNSGNGNAAVGQFVGTIDEAAYYTHTLSATRIAAHYAAGIASLPASTTTINATRAGATAPGRAPTVAVVNDATITPTRAGATATGRAPTLGSVTSASASVTPTRATAAATAKPATTNITADAGVDAFIFATPGFARVDRSDTDVEVQVDLAGAVITPFPATASVVASDPEVSATYTTVSGTRHRWRLYDPATGERWEFIHNPNQMTSPHLPRAISIFVTPPLYNPAVEARGGMARVHETNTQPYEWSFSGWIREEAQYEQLLHWTRKVTRLQLTDHFGRTWWIRFKEFDPDEQRPSHRSDWRFDYDIKATMYGAVA